MSDNSALSADESPEARPSSSRCVYAVPNPSAVGRTHGWDPNRTLDYEMIRQERAMLKGKELEDGQ